ncbi:TonB-dependent receptor [Sphingomonas sp.]|uniref:TonB-dependent receptor n=1 Tax=Sphingomonas sp. TaxID=28214 RepID=UPI0025F4D1A8|nr:TonB-dependent receptor [Sphingomonas sp.]
MKIRVLALVSTVLCSPAFASEAPTPEIVVTAPREEEQARAKQKLAPNLINVQSAEAIAKYPDFNAAESLSRIPGISLSSDTGEGRFVNIRGIDGNLNGATYGGVVLLNTNPGGTIFGSGRAVEFDTIPTGAIDGIIVSKTGMPNHDAEGLGGSIELTPRSAAHVEHPFAEGAIGYGYEPAHKHGGPLNLDLAVGARFGGDNKPFSFVLTGSRRDDKRGFDDVEADYINDDTLTATSGKPFSAQQVNKAFADIQLRRYDYHRRRFGYGGEFAFTPNDDHQIYLRASIAGYVESVRKNRLTFDNLDGSPLADPANPNGFTALSDLSIKGTDEKETHRNQVYVVGGHDRFGDFNLDYHAAYSRATFFVNQNYLTNFAGPTGVAVTYDNITNPDFPKIAITDGTDPNNAALYTQKAGPGGLKNFTERAVDKEWSYAANGTLETHFGSTEGRIQFGGEVRTRTKTDLPFAQSFVSPAVNLATVSSPAITNFYDNHYTNGPQIDVGAIRNLANSSPTSGLVPDYTGYFRATEDIYATYGMYTLTAGKFGALAGVRVEWTDARYTADAVGNGDTADIRTRKRNYINTFPTVQLRYDISPKLLARATYSTGIGRPGFAQVAKPVNVDTDNNIITRGNPDLQPTTGDNYDLALELYLPHSGIVSVGLFDKEFKNYIVARRQPAASDPLLPNPSSPITINSYENVPKAHARGIEVAYTQKFSFLPAPFDGFGFDGNATYVDSEVELRTGERRRLPASSKYTWNAAALYEAHGVELRLAAQYVGLSLFGIGDEARFDVYQSPRTTLDFTSSLDITRNVRVYFNAKNLTNAPLRLYEGSPDRPIQREFYDQTYEAGVKFKF